VELAEELLGWLGLLLPRAMHLVVLADSLFDGQRLFAACRARGWTFITKLKTNRTFADAPGTRVAAYGKALAEDKFRRCRLCRRTEATAAYRRQGSRRPRAHEKRGAARTAVLLRQVRREAQRSDLRWIEERLATPSRRRQLRQALRRAA
jgi:hypothetical protein